MRSTTEVFEDHLAKRLAGKVTEDITKNYAENIVLLSGTGTFTGHEGIQQSAAELAAHTKGATFTYNHTLVHGPYAFLEWTAESDHMKVTDGADSFVIQDGKIVFQSVHYSVTQK